MATIIAVAQCAVPLGQLVMGLVFRNTTTNVFLPLLMISVFVLLISFVCFMMFRETKESDLKFQVQVSHLLKFIGYLVFVGYLAAKDSSDSSFNKHSRGVA